MDSAGAGRSVRQTTGLGSRPAPRGGLRPVTAGAAVIVVVAAGFTPPGRAAIAGSFAFLEFFTGVFSLVGLSITVLLGLAATDRLVLLIRHRILLQLAHRATAATALVCLAIHVATKLVEGHAHLWDPAIPFLANHRPVQVGLGTLAGYLMIIATWTGVTRASYARSRQPGRWRILHASAYAAWLLALIHGLGAGRSAKTWVLVSYGICLALVALALLVRFFVALSRRTHLARAQTIRRMRPVGRPTAVEATPLATNVLIPSLDGTEWADAERRPADHDDPRPAATSAGRTDRAGAAAPGRAGTVEPGRADRAGAIESGRADRAATVEPDPAVEPPVRASRASAYRPYRPLRADVDGSPAQPSQPAPAGRTDTGPAREEPRARPAPVAPERIRARREAPEDPVPPAAARRLDDTAEITDEEFWAYIRNEVGR
ncbi:hypothetical protein ACIBPB_31460 [Micromonospora sp. NPDC049836]|uniref:hypothetical protein n=1 Tax=Micromonospora sp. NPDC049836 TaxID=3364274 RepID=UPI0037AEADEB